MQVIKGTYGSRRTAIGYLRLCRVMQKRALAALFSAERQRLYQALEIASGEIALMRRNAEESVGEEHGEIFGIYLDILSSESVTDRLIAYLGNGLSSEDAIASLLSEDRIIADGEFSRGHIKEALELLSGVLADVDRPSPSPISEESSRSGSYIYVSDGRSPEGLLSLLAQAAKRGGDEPAGAVCLTADELSAAISMGLPAMMIDPDELPSDGLDGVTAILDCRRRRLIIDPDLSELERYSDERRRTEARSEELSELIGRRSVTLSGRRIYLCCELDLQADCISPSSIPEGGDPRVLITTDGIMSNSRGELDPSEDGQFAVYKKWAESPYDVTVRLFEHPPSEMWHTEPHGGIRPASGLHGAGLFGLLRSTYKKQIMAILRAASYGRLSILVPSLCGVGELSQLRSILREAKGELRERGTDFTEPFAIGVELSTPAAVLEAEALSGESDFTVIDLDRLVSLTSGAELYDPISEDRLRGGIIPALGLCAHAVDLSRGKGDLIGVRGSLVSDGDLTHTLIDSGFELLFLGSDGILPVKEQVLIYNGD